MRKIIYVIISFAICNLLNLQALYLSFVSVYLLMSMFKINEDFLWEIPLSLMLCDVILIAFSEDINVLVYILTIGASVIISIVSPRKLLFLFPIVIVAVILKNSYAIASLWAGIWYGMRTAFGYFTTKRADLQEHKL